MPAARLGAPAVTVMRTTVEVVGVPLAASAGKAPTTVAEPRCCFVTVTLDAGGGLFVALYAARSAAVLFGLPGVV